MGPATTRGHAGDTLAHQQGICGGAMASVVAGCEPIVPHTAEEEDIPSVDYATAAWFTGCDGDLATSYWMLGLCYRSSDAAVLTSETLVRRAVGLQRVLTWLRSESKNGGWRASAIVEAVVEATPTEAHTRASSVISSLEFSIVEMAAELIVNRVELGDVEQLTRWESHLAKLWPDASRRTDSEDLCSANGEETTASRSVDPCASAAESTEDPAAPGTGDEHASTTALPPPLPKENVASLPKKGTIAFVKYRLHAAIDFHRPYETQLQASIVMVDEVPATITAQWTHEITTFVEMTGMTPADDAIRRAVATEIQDTVRRSRFWKTYEVVLFGSSVTTLGSRTSDLDMSMRVSAVSVSTAEAEMTPSGTTAEHRTFASRNGYAAFVKSLLDRCQFSLVTVQTQALKLRDEGTDKNDSKLKTVELFVGHWKALVAALRSAYDNLGSSENDFNRSKVESATIVQRPTKWQKKQHRDEITAIAGLLGQNGCIVSDVVTRGRVPVVRFTHTASGFDCDLCLNNYQASVNTQLLRTYAEDDDRVRLLGMAIKHWAKQRGINDAKSRYLSSYSYIMLVIYFLQRKVRLLPKLQDPELLREANVKATRIEGVDTTFCADVAKARAFHATQLKKMPLAGDLAALTVGDLLVPFFRFYVEEFNFDQHVVSIRLPYLVRSKLTRWGARNFKPWRISIEDPFEPGRDLGSVLIQQCQQRIFDEMKRALSLLRQGQNFMHPVCESLHPAVPTPVVQAPVAVLPWAAPGTSFTLNPKAPAWTPGK